MKQIIIILSCFLFSLSYSQQIDKNEEEVLINKILALKIKKNSELNYGDSTLIIYNRNGEIKSQKNWSSKTNSIVNDKNGVAELTYTYKKGLLITIIHLNINNDTIKETDFGYKENILVEIIHSKPINNNVFSTQKMELNERKYSKNLTYPQAKDPTDYVEKMFARPNFIKYETDSIGRITKEMFLNKKNNPVPFAEMRIHSISYAYDESNRLSSETFHMDTDYNGIPNQYWKNAFFYNSENQLTKIKQYLNRDNVNADYITYFKYDVKNKLYGSGRNIDEININKVYINFQDVVKQSFFYFEYYGEHYPWNPTYNFERENN